MTIGTIRGSLETNSTPASCSSVSSFCREEAPAFAVRSNDLDLGSLQNDADVLLVASEVRAALDIVRLDLYAEFCRRGERILTPPTLLTQAPESRPLRREDAKSHRRRHRKKRVGDLKSNKESVVRARATTSTANRKRTWTLPAIFSAARLSSSAFFAGPAKGAGEDTASAGANLEARPADGS